MAWAPLLLAVLAHSSGFLVQAAVTQPPSVSANLGQTVKITCSGIDTGSGYAGWYQQKVPGHAPVTMIYWNSNRPSDIPSRFSGSASGSTATLTIAGVQAEDEAVYFCGGYDVSLCGIFGAGTMLTVLGQPKTSPSVYLFPPSSQELSSESKATLVCLLEGFYPGVAQVTWTADGKVISKGVETGQPQRQSNNKYMASSYLMLNAGEWSSHENYSCKVTHEAGNVEKSLKRSECSR
ncbi:immunoglobulin lambda-1 light chain-like isoform X9 [Apus apus]|uniref:immunoglobulin lambda-1 light chain-like isoform X9 n=1 Tax=Apus apus TaxID=8895 RepID=UPI0021F864AA|nr:immunoglobulin lambda-1 light chain-like isoform X9 [Apus apus]